MQKIIRKQVHHVIVGMILLLAVTMLTATAAYATDQRNETTITDIRKLDVEITGTYFYGEERPEVHVYDKDTALKEGVDYISAIFPDYEEGVGKAYVKGINYYCSVVVTTFEIETIGENLSSYASSDEFLGIPYVWGGTSKEGFDCSGFVQYVFNQYGISLNRTTYEQCEQGTRIESRANLQPGDLIFFSDFGHVGIYIGEGRFVHSSNGGVKVTVLDNDPRDGTYYSTHYCGATRIF